MKFIQSRDNAFFKQLRKLAESGRERRKAGLTLLDGVHLVEAYEQAIAVLDTLVVAESALASGEIADYVAGLAVRAESALVDGNRCPQLDIPVEAVVKGDGKIASIAAASILAKTVRDAGMLALHTQYPQYGFDRHMGYPTAAHFKALQEHGASPVHRRSFGPVAAQLSLL